MKMTRRAFLGTSASLAASPALAKLDWIDLKEGPVAAVESAVVQNDGFYQSMIIEYTATDSMGKEYWGQSMVDPQGRSLQEVLSNLRAWSTTPPENRELFGMFVDEEDNTLIGEPTRVAPLSFKYEKGGCCTVQFHEQIEL